MKVGGFWFLTPFSTIFQLYHSIGGGKQSTQRKTKTSCKSLTNFITKCCIEYTTPWVGFELKVSVVIGIDCTGNCKSHYHTITTTTVPFSCMNIILKCSYLKIESIEKSKNEICTITSISESAWGETKEYKICICFFSSKHVPLKSKSNDRLVRSQQNVLKWRWCVYQQNIDFLS